MNKQIIKRRIIKYKSILILGMVQLLIANISAFALDCNKSPCHKNCISSQPNSVQTQCRCNSRKKVYYHYWGTNYGVPEYDMACDGTFEQYSVKYCAAKRRYDDFKLNNYNSNVANSYTPQYDPICDGSHAEYTQNIQILKQNQAINNYADALRNQHVQIDANVYHQGTVNHNVNQNVNFNGTMYHY